MSGELYCPRCGKPFTSDTSFCRTCGLSLDGVSEIVNGETESAPIVSSRPNLKLMRLGMVTFILGMVIGLLNGALRDFNLFPQAYGKLVFLAFIAMGLLMLGAGFLFPTKKYTKRKTPRPAANSPSESKLKTAPLKGQLESARADVNDALFAKDEREFETVPVPSVTEHTTRDLS